MTNAPELAGVIRQSFALVGVQTGAVLVTPAAGRRLHILAAYIATSAPFAVLRLGTTVVHAVRANTGAVGPFGLLGGVLGAVDESLTINTGTGDTEVVVAYQER